MIRFFFSIIATLIFSLDSLMSQSILFESDRIFKEYILGKLVSIDNISLKYGFKAKSNSADKNSDDIFEYYKEYKIDNEKVTDKVFLSIVNETGERINKFEKNKKLELSLSFVQFTSEYNLNKIYEESKDYLKSKIDQRIYSTCGNISNIDKDILSRKFRNSQEYCFQESEYKSNKSISFNYKLNDISLLLDSPDWIMTSCNSIKAIIRPNIGVLSTTINITIPNLDCNYLPTRYESYHQALRYILNYKYEFSEAINKSSSWIGESSFYSCNGTIGFLIFKTGDHVYIHSEVPLWVWNEFKNSVSIGKYYNENIKYRYQLVVDP